MNIRGLSSFLLTSIIVIGFGSGCVTNGRRVLLKEYGPSIAVQESSPLKGATVCLSGFTCAPDLVNLEPPGKPIELAQFKYIERTQEQDKRWDAEMKALEKQTSKKDWHVIGNMRNGLGMVMSHVYALNDPATWLLESLKFDLEAQGAKVVDSTEGAKADAMVSGTVQICRTDMYFVVNGTLVINLEVQPRIGASRKKQIHTHGATAAMLASDGEYFHALRDARQKFSILAMGEISECLKQNRQAAER